MERLIELIKYLTLAIIQGVCEIFPISSSGHLILARKLLGVSAEGVAIELILHLSSLFALLVYYRKTILSLIVGCYKYLLLKDGEQINEYKFVRGMIIALIPTCLVGCVANDYFDSFLKYPVLIGVLLIFNAFNLFSIRNKNGDKKIEELSFWSFVKIGLGQCLGLVPGFSRSGSALSMCYRERIGKEDSEKFTFLMLFPLVLGSMVLNVGDFSFSSDEWLLLLISFIVSFTFTLLCVGSLSNIVKNNKLHYFAYYSFLVGLIVMFIC